MSRNGAGIFTLNSNYKVAEGDTILPSQHNLVLEDIETDLNAARPIVAGGTGATTASGARTALSVYSKGETDSGFTEKVATTSGLKDVDTSSHKVAFVLDKGKLFTWETGDFTDEAAADPDEAFYIPATGIATSLGVWRAASGSTAEIAALGAIADDVTAVAGITGDVTTVAGISDDVTTVAGISGDVSTVAAIPAGEITTVATRDADIGIVADRDADIGTVAARDADIGTVAGIDTAVSAVAGISGDVSAVAAIASDVTTAAGNVADITNFADVYIGPSATAPTTRGDGSPLQVGDLYFDTTSGQMKAYTGSAWVGGTGDMIAATYDPNGKAAEVLFKEDNLAGLPAAALGNLGGVGAVRVTKFTASGTYVPDEHLIFAIVECEGAGGGGGSASANSAYSGGAGGGGAGGYSKAHFTKSEIGGSQTVTIGAGGAGATAANSTGSNGSDTSFGSLCLAKGGKGGPGSGGGAGGPGGQGGSLTGAVGDITILGRAGHEPNNTQSAAVFGFGGRGADSVFGRTLSDGQAPAGQIANGSAGTGYGSGGNGGSQSGASTGVGSGGNGASGICVVTEFCSE